MMIFSSCSSPSLLEDDNDDADDCVVVVDDGIGTCVRSRKEHSIGFKRWNKLATQMRN